MQKNKMSILALNDPQVLAIPIKDCREPLIDVRHLNTLRFGPPPEDPNNMDYTKLRQGIYDRLIKADQFLPPGLHLCLYEGWRSLQLQERLFEDQKRRVFTQNSDYDQNKLFQEAAKMVSPIKNLDGSMNIPPHNTGAAVDVYLLDDNDTIIDMGLKVSDWIQDITGEISVTTSTLITSSACLNRKIMSAALRQAGFANYPGEYWHWSYGDRYWAYLNHEKVAVYGSIDSI